MSRNKFLLDFNLGPATDTDVYSNEWMIERRIVEKKMREWCEERLNEQGFPRWQFSTRTVRTPGASTIVYIDDLADGIFIFDEEARTAFKLTFEL